MLNIQPFKDSPSHCGIACLRMILKYYGIEITEKKLAKLAKYDPNKGMDGEEIVKLAKILGLKAKMKNFGSIKEIRGYLTKKIPVIVDWFMPDLVDPDGHYSVVMDIDKENIYLQDPYLGHLRALRLETFKRLWFDFSGDYIRKKQDISLRGIIVIYPRTRKPRASARGNSHFRGPTTPTSPTSPTTPTRPSVGLRRRPSVGLRRRSR